MKDSSGEDEGQFRAILQAVKPSKTFKVSENGKRILIPHGYLEQMESELLELTKAVKRECHPGSATSVESKIQRNFFPF